MSLATSFIYCNYKINIINDNYSCGDMLIIEYITRRCKILTQEYYTCQYLRHIIASNGMLYILCKSHTLTNRILIIIDRFYNRVKELIVNGCNDMKELDGYIILDGNMIYHIIDRNIITRRINREY